MKLDKETVIALIICMALLMSWPSIQNYIWPPPPPSRTPPSAKIEKAEAPKSTARSSKPVETGRASGKPAGDKSVAGGGDILEPKSKSDPVINSELTPRPVVNSANLAASPCVDLENDYIRATINPNLAAVTKVVLKKYKNADKKSLVSLFSDDAAALALLPSGNSFWKLLSTELSTVDDTGATVDDVGAIRSVSLKRTFETSSGGSFEMVQTWAIKDEYTITSRVDIRNTSAKPLDLGRLFVSTGGIPNIHSQCGDKVPFRENHEIDFFNLETEKVVSISAGSSPGFFAMITGAAKNAPKKPFLKKEAGPAKWVAVTNRYFVSLLVPVEPFSQGVVAQASVAERKDGEEYIVAKGNGVVRLPDPISPNAVRSLSFECFAGPKKMRLLAVVDPDASKIMRLYIMGMVFLEPLSRLLLTALLWLKAWCGSYGWSIVLLTLIVKTIFWPVTHKANVSMRKMQKIQPMLKEIRKEFKDNPQKMHMEMMKLQKEHNVSPLGGCLPMLLQMPVFLALYATLSGTVEPRQASFLWAGDLSLPDTIFTIPGLGLPIRPLMLMMTATMVLQQKLTPTAADPAQQKVMMFMPLLMLVMLYSLPSGLTLYWTVSQFISVAQLVVNKELERREELREAAASSS
ncbi:MAG: membrane protein insertase YidC [Kiritimatiellaeota bacterium]|nr:membrane protein insertase YidC [Kiritimatiellota bacterium]